MLEHTLDTVNAILHVRPKTAIEKNDFVQLAKAVDPFIEKSGGLAGLVVDAPQFPGWDSFGALVEHIRFVRDHQKHIRKIALVTDSAMGSVAERLGAHFASAEIRHFPASQLEAAGQWVMARA